MYKVYLYHIRARATARKQTLLHTHVTSFQMNFQRRPMADIICIILITDRFKLIKILCCIGTNLCYIYRNVRITGSKSLRDENHLPWDYHLHKLMYYFVCFKTALMTDIQSVLYYFNLSLCFITLIN